MENELLKRIEAELGKVGARLRKLRKERDWRLEDLAQRTGLSTSYLSRIEGGEREPSLAALFNVAAAYGVPFSSLFEPEPQAEEHVVTRADSLQLQRGRGLLYVPLSVGKRDTNLQPLRVTVLAEREGDELYRHEGEEWLYVLSGKLELVLADRQYVLGPGDSAHFDASEPHRLNALDGEDTEVILIAAAVPYPLLRSYM